MSQWQCGYQSPRMKGPCVLWKNHLNYEWSQNHRSARSTNQDTPKLREFRRIVLAGLDRGVQLSYVEIGELMNHPNLRSVSNYGLGSRYTKLRQELYAERGVKPRTTGRTPEQSAKIVADMREVLDAIAADLD